MFKPKVATASMSIGGPPSEKPKNGVQAKPQPEFLVTYGTGGVKSSASLRVISLPQFFQKLIKPQAEMEVLHELWDSFTIYTREERYQQHRKIELTFPFAVAGAVYDKEADLADEENHNAGWRRLSGLVVLSFKYRFVKGSEERTAKNRELLQTQLLALPLLGPSIVLMAKVPGECMLYVFIAAGAMKSYAARASTIAKYVYVACPTLRRRLYGSDMMADERHIVGFDPLAYLRPRPVDGYARFPVKLAQAAIAECEGQRNAGLNRKRGNGCIRR